MEDNASTHAFNVLKSFPLEILRMIFSNFDITADWEALLACWSIAELKPVLRSVLDSWRIRIVAYQYSRNQCIELGVQFASSHHCFILNLVSNRVNVSPPLICRVLNSWLFENLLVNNLTALNVKSIVLMRDLLVYEDFIVEKTFPETAGEILILLDCSRTPTYVGIRVEAIESENITVTVPSNFVDIFRRLNILRFQDERCRAYTIRPFSEAVVTVDSVMNLWLSRHKDFLRKSQDQHEFGKTYSANYPKRNISISRYDGNPPKRRKTTKMCKMLKSNFNVICLTFSVKIISY